MEGKSIIGSILTGMGEGCRYSACVDVGLEAAGR